MKRVITNKVKEEYAPGKFSEPMHVLQIAGEEKQYSSSTVTFKVFDVQSKVIKRDPTNPNSVLSESVFFGDVKKDVKIPDSTGGNACGRKFKSWGYTPEEVEISKKDNNYYTYLFGEITFPGQAPVLANFRMPTSIVKSWYTFQNNLGKNRAPWASYLLELVASPQKKEQFTAVDFAVKQSGLLVDTNTDRPNIDIINSFIQEHNSNILKQVA